MSFEQTSRPCWPFPSPVFPFFHLLSPPVTAFAPKRSQLEMRGSWTAPNSGSLVGFHPASSTSCPIPMPYRCLLSAKIVDGLRCHKPLPRRLPPGDSPLPTAFRLCPPLLPFGTRIVIKPLLFSGNVFSPPGTRKMPKISPVLELVVFLSTFPGWQTS